MTHASRSSQHQVIPALAALLVLMLISWPVGAAEHSPTLDNLISITAIGEPVPVILFLNNRLEMEDVYPTARTLPMSERRQFVIHALQERFNEMSPRVMER